MVLCPVFFVVPQAALEIADPLTEPGHELRDLVCSEEQNDDHEHDDHFCGAKIHDPFGLAPEHPLGQRHL